MTALRNAGDGTFIEAILGFFQIRRDDLMQLVREECMRLIQNTSDIASGTRVDDVLRSMGLKSAHGEQRNHQAQCRSLD